MSFAIIGTVMAVSTAAQMYGQIQTGKMQQDEYKKQAEEAELAAKNESLMRMEELNRNLAANNVSLAAGGMKIEGTPSSIAMESAKKIGSSEAMESLSSKLKIAALKRAGKNARATANIQATSTLLNNVTNFATLYKMKKGD
jgi:transcriptional regulator with GAF, ATPase, and Fis domain